MLLRQCSSWSGRSIGDSLPSRGSISWPRCSACPSARCLHRPLSSTDWSAPPVCTRGSSGSASRASGCSRRATMRDSVVPRFTVQGVHMKMKMLTFTSLALVACLAAVSPARAQQTKDIVDTAVAAGSFKTLAKALAAADLVGTLKGPGPFTVFAPTDEAFAKLPAGTVEALLKPENKAKLRRILTYHVVAGTVKAADVVKLHTAKAVSGDTIRIATRDGGVMVDEAR